MGVEPKIGGKHPKLSILIGFSLINHPFWDNLIFGNTQINNYIPNPLNESNQMKSTPSIHPNLQLIFRLRSCKDTHSRSHTIHLSLLQVMTSQEQSNKSTLKKSWESKGFWSSKMPHSPLGNSPGLIRGPKNKAGLILPGGVWHFRGPKARRFRL